MNFFLFFKLFVIRKGQNSPYAPGIRRMQGSRTGKQNEKSFQFFLEEHKKGTLNKGFFFFGVGFLIKLLQYNNIVNSQINMRTLQKIYGNPIDKKPCFRKLYEQEEITPKKNLNLLASGVLRKAYKNGIYNKFPKIS